jgi:hypothetical protein
MATAPRPGGERKAAEATRRFQITLKGRMLELVAAVSLQEKIAVRYATGLPFEAFYGGEQRLGTDSLAVLWWLARRANGEPALSWAGAAADWPADLGPDDVDLVLVDDDDEEPTDDPEGSGPAS